MVEIDRSSQSEATMLMNRNAMVGCAVVAVLAVAASTAAEAGGRFFSPFCHRGGFANIAKSYNPAPPRHRVASVKQKSDDDEKYKRPAKNYRPTVAPVKLSAVANAAVLTTAATTTTTCLTKEYLDTGVVMFKDTCTSEWAINSTNVDTKVSSVVRTCLTKDNSQNGVVVFKDTCTNEWAMNTIDQQAQSAQAR
jgi:hypothetical protein